MAAGLQRSFGRLRGSQPPPLQVHLREKDFADGPWAQSNVEAGACMLIAVKSGGVLVVGELSITYLCGGDFKSIATPCPMKVEWTFSS